MTPVAIVVQARTSSRRLPNKVLMPLAGAPALVRMSGSFSDVQLAMALVRTVVTQHHMALPSA